MKNLLMLCGIAITLSSTALATTPSVDKREQNQQQRIAQGVKSGQLTASETIQLAKGQKQLRQMERRAKADGIVTKKERARLHNKANKESAKIRHNKHNNQKRPKAQ